MRREMEPLIEEEEEEESRFFDANEEMVSCSTPNNCEESQSLLPVPDSSISSAFEYDVWTKSPVNAEERREKFLNWMGVNVNQTHREESVKLDNVDRFSSSVTETAVLRSLKSDDEFSSCRCDSSLFSPRENVDRVVNEVSSGMVLRNLGFEDDISSSHCSGSSGLTDRIVSEVVVPKVVSVTEQRDVGGIMKRVKEIWLNRLHKVRNKERLEDSVTDFGSRIERVKVKEYKKETKELSALFKGQEIQAHEGAILAMKFSPDGRYLASAGEDGVLRVWSVVEDERSEEHDVPKMDPSCIYFEVSKLSELRPVAVEKEAVSGSLMSPKKTTESACVIIPPRIFRVLEKPIHEFFGHSGDILDVSWSKNNKN